MLQFDTKFLQFLVVLSQKKEISGMTTLANTSGLSRRMLYYYLEKTNDLLKSVNLPPLEKQDRGKLHISKIQQQQIITWIEGQIPKEYIWSTNERRLLMLLLILVESRKWQLKHFQKLFLMSRNTVLTDIQWVKDFLKVSEILLKSNKEKGYYLNVNELKRRQLIFQQLYLIETGQKATFFSFLIKALQFESENITETLSEIEKPILKTKEVLNKEITLQDSRILAKLIFLLQHRSKAGILPVWSTVEAQMIQERLEYQAAKKIIGQLPHYFHPDYVEKEALYYGMLLLCIEKNVDAHFMSNPFENLIYVTKNFIYLFEKIAGIHFHNRKRLLEKVQTHMKVLHYRHIFDMQMLHHSGISAKNQYKKAFQLTEKVSHLMKSDVVFQASFPDGFSKDELSELTLLFEEAILREQSRRDVPQLLIVSDYSDVLNSLLETHIHQILPQALIVGILKSDVAHLYPGKVDFCISTDKKYVHFQGETLFVSIVLTPEDKRRIKTIRKETALELDTREKIKHLMNQFQFLDHQESFINELEKMIQESDENDVVKKSISLADFIEDSNFCFMKSKIESFREALHILAAPLLENNYMQATYYQQIKKEIQDQKLVFLFPKILLVHTDYRFGSMKPGCSFLCMEEPMITKKGEEVQLIIFMTTEESMAHVPLLFELDCILSHQFLPLLLELKSFKKAYHLCR